MGFNFVDALRCASRRNYGAGVVVMIGVVMGFGKI